MSMERLREVIREVTREVIWGLNRDPEMRRWQREVIIQTIVELEDARKAGYARSFLDACAARGIQLRWNRDTEKMVCNDPKLMTPELKAILIVHRPEIVGVLRRMADQEMAAETRRLDYEKQRAERRLDYEKQRAERNGHK